ncbi:MAG: type II toxin-antitoxin system RelE/ParE family toxin [Chthoniobacterales bacterium]
MDFKVLIAESALNDLRETVEFVAQDDPAAADRLGYKLLACTLSLAAMPQRFAFHDRSRGIRKMSAPPFLIYYTCDESRRVANVLHFWHSARRTPDFTA